MPSDSRRSLPLADVVSAISDEDELRLEDVQAALESMTASDLEELGALLDEYDAAVRRHRREPRN